LLANAFFWRKKFHVTSKWGPKMAVLEKKYTALFYHKMWWQKNNTKTELN